MGISTRLVKRGAWLAYFSHSKRATVRKAVQGKLYSLVLNNKISAEQLAKIERSMLRLVLGNHMDAGNFSPLVMGGLRREDVLSHLGVPLEVSQAKISEPEISEDSVAQGKLYDQILNDRLSTKDLAKVDRTLLRKVLGMHMDAGNFPPLVKEVLRWNDVVSHPKADLELKAEVLEITLKKYAKDKAAVLSTYMELISAFPQEYELMRDILVAIIDKGVWNWETIRECAKIQTHEGMQAALFATRKFLRIGRTSVPGAIRQREEIAAEAMLISPKALGAEVATFDEGLSSYEHKQLLRRLYYGELTIDDCLNKPHLVRTEQQARRAVELSREYIGNEFDVRERILRMMAGVCRQVILDEKRHFDHNPRDKNQVGTQGDKDLLRELVSSA